MSSQRVFIYLWLTLFVPPFIRRSSSPEINAELKLSLQWFVEVLELNIHELQLWKRQRRAPLHLYCDARGEPPRVAAVLFVSVFFWQPWAVISHRVCLLCQGMVAF